MRDAEADIAEALSNDGWLTVLDGPLHGIRHRRGLPVIGFLPPGLDVGSPARATPPFTNRTSRGCGRGPRHGRGQPRRGHRVAVGTRGRWPAAVDVLVIDAGRTFR